MITAHHAEQSSRVGERSLLDVLYPGAIYADRYFVLGFARNRARMAADTLAVIDDEAEVHKLIEEWVEMILGYIRAAVETGKFLPQSTPRYLFVCFVVCIF